MIVIKILIVEDEVKLANAISKGLRGEKYITEYFTDGQDGLDMAMVENYDLIILDRMLPSIDGVTICKRLRENNIKTPILILTAKGAIKDKVEGLNAGADDYLVKPFSFEELLARIRAILRRPKDIKNNILKIDNLTLNTITYEVKRVGEKIKLSTTEFRLLEYLMRNIGMILSKEKIIEHVWDFDSDILENTVESYIGSLRKKIDKPFPSYTSLIKTVHGFGYKMEI